MVLCVPHFDNNSILSTTQGSDSFTCVSCGASHKEPVLRIRDVYPRSRIPVLEIFVHPDSGSNNNKKEEGEKFVVLSFFWEKFYKIENYFIF